MAGDSYMKVAVASSVAALIVVRVNHGDQVSKGLAATRTNPPTSQHSIRTLSRSTRW